MEKKIEFTLFTKTHNGNKLYTINTTFYIKSLVGISNIDGVISIREDDRYTYSLEIGRFFSVHTIGQEIASLLKVNQVIINL